MELRFSVSPPFKAASRAALQSVWEWCSFATGVPGFPPQSNRNLVYDVPSPVFGRMDNLPKTRESLRSVHSLRVMEPAEGQYGPTPKSFDAGTWTIRERLMKRSP